MWIRPFRDLIYTMPPYICTDDEIDTICAAMLARSGGRLMGGWEKWLTDEAVRRDAAGLTRRLRPRGPDDAVVDLAGNDYLGLSRDPDGRGRGRRGGARLGRRRRGLPPGDRHARPCTRRSSRSWPRSWASPPHS